VGSLSWLDRFSRNIRSMGRLPRFDRFIRNIRSIVYSFIFIFSRFYFFHVFFQFYFSINFFYQNFSIPIRQYNAFTYPPTHLDKMTDKDHYRIPVLSRDNHETWFQDMSFKLRGKEIFYVIETIMRKYT
jgi:hypothetical protein